MSEDQICIDFFDTLKQLHKFNQLNGIFFHVPNEISGNKNPVFGAKLKRMGKISGVADYIFMWGNDCGCIEMKTEKGKLTANQLEFQEWCQTNNVKYQVCRSSSKAIDCLVEWGFVK
jgi:hypothetical protein